MHHILLIDFKELHHLEKRIQISYMPAISILAHSLSCEHCQFECIVEWLVHLHPVVLLLLINSVLI